MGIWIGAPISATCCDCKPAVCDSCACATPGITSSLSTCGNTYTAFTYTITATGSPTSFSATGLPSGLSINTGTGVISGTPSSTTSTYINIGATNACGTTYASLYIRLNAGFSTTGSGGPGEAGVTCIDDSYAVTADFVCSQRITFTAAGSMTDWQLVVKANGSNVYNSGCVEFNASPIVTTITIPAGTTTIRVVGTCGCSTGSTDSLQYSITSP